MNGPNRLANETSPYLRQHQDNPVDWYPWGDDAFDRARAEDRPVLLSVGYSACHWCHVMAHESFEDDATAAVMNQLFVNIKVDREERPDVDAIYMEAVQAMTGRGGWPMTVFLTPTGKPFFGGTYFPRAHFNELLHRVDDVWRNRRADIDAQADELTADIGRGLLLEPGGDVVGFEVINGALDQLARQYDPDWGGFGGAPKFPQTMSLELVLRAYVHNRAEGAHTLVTNSLDAMASGGIYDHLGGGFARYATDERWLVPHFEKMLYDQALLARIYLHAWQVTGQARYRQVLDETIEYVARDLRHPEGGFYSAEDADSPDEQGHSVEGAFYVWTEDQLREVLTEPGLADAAIAWWGVAPGGNFEGRSILWRPERGDLLRPPAVDTARRQLFEAREHRPRPGLDDKVLTEWNGLMLATVAEAAAATDSADWRELAVANAEFLLDRLRRPDGRWLRSWQADGGARHLAYAADYGALIDAFTRLAEATGEARWIAEARAAADGLLALFWDDERGGVFTTGHDAAPLVSRPKDLLDNATPSANSLAAFGLLRLAALTGEARYEQRATDILRLLGGLAAQHPMAFGHLLAALDLHATGLTEVAVVGQAPELVQAVAQRYLPHAVLAWGEPFDSPLWEGRGPTEDMRPRAFVCRNFTCEAPVTEVDELIRQLS